MLVCFTFVLIYLKQLVMSHCRPGSSSGIVDRALDKRVQIWLGGEHNTNF
jgi:hypothetical protein